MTDALAHVDSWFGLLEDQLSALWVDALNPLLDPVLAGEIVSVLFDGQPPDERLHPVLLTGSGRPDIVLIDDQCRVHAVIENKAGAAINVRTDGQTQLQAYEQENDPGRWLPGLRLAPAPRYILLAAGPAGGILQPPWRQVGYGVVRAAVDVLCDRATGDSGPSPEARSFWTRFRAELSLVMNEPAPLNTAHVVEGCALATLPFPTGSQAALVRRTQGYLASAGSNRALPDMTSVTMGSVWEYEHQDRWVTHRLRGSGDWAGVSIWFGIPGVLRRAGSRVVVGQAEPPGQLGRLYVSVRDDRIDDQQRGVLQDWFVDLVQHNEVLSLLLRTVEYPPHEQRLEGPVHALGFWAFDPLAVSGQDASPAHRCQETLVRLAGHLVRQLSNSEVPVPLRQTVSSSGSS